MRQDVGQNSSSECADSAEGYLSFAVGLGLEPKPGPGVGAGAGDPCSVLDSGRRDRWHGFTLPQKPSVWALAPAGSSF